MAKHWLVRPENIKRLWIGFAALLVLTLLAGLAVEHEGHFGLDGSFGFFAGWGFISCVALVAFAKLLGIFLKRDDTYYDG